MCKTARSDPYDTQTVLQEEIMKYCDLHCDALTASNAEKQITRGHLTASGCFLQCFAAFVSEEKERFSAALGMADELDALCEKEGYHLVKSADELREDKINALFTVEDGGAIEGDLGKLNTLYGRGMRMMSLTWNFPNELGYPSFPDYKGLCAGRVPFEKRETERGLTARGREAVEAMCGLGVLADVSHGSDRLFFEVADICKSYGKPFVASHTAANSVHDCARNLTDEQLRRLGDCGGVAGLYFCADFLSSDVSAEGQKRAILAHARAMLNAGGEDVLCIGSDFDGIPPNPAMKNAGEIPWLFEELIKEFGSRVTEKIAYGNFLRVLSER